MWAGEPHLALVKLPCRGQEKAGSCSAAPEVLQHPSGVPPVGDGCKGQLEAPEPNVYLNLLLLLEICIVRHLHVVNIGAEFSSLG